MAKLTVQQIEALKPKDKPYKKNVDLGLQIRIPPNGKKSWVVQYVMSGKQREYRLPRLYGTVTDGGHYSLKDARTEAERIRALAREGIDYKVKLDANRLAAAQLEKEKSEEEEAQRKTAQTENLTFTDLFETWLQDGVRRKDGNAELERSFKKDVVPHIGSVRVKDLTEHHIRNVIRYMVVRKVNRSAVVVFRNLTQMFIWAEKRQPWRKLLAEGNPIELVDIRKLVSPEYDLRNQRNRILSPEEIRELSQLLAKMRTNYESAPDRRFALRPLERTTELSIWIMLATLCRVGELSKARWDHVNLEEATWFIPAQNTKGQTGQQNALTVYLSPFALEQFKALHALTGETDWCFPATFKEDHISEKTITKQIGDRQIMFKKNKNRPMTNRSRAGDALVLSAGRNGEWTPHDLRRTGATMMQQLGVNLDIIDRCQNHVLHGSKIRRHYLHHDYAEEKKEAWRLLGKELTILKSRRSNVVQLLNYPKSRQIPA